MKPDKVVLLANGIGANISRSTLLRYEKQGLISTPLRENQGGAGNRIVLYATGTVEEAFASYSLLHGKYRDETWLGFSGGKDIVLNSKVIPVLRRIGLKLLKTDNEKEYLTKALNELDGYEPFVAHIICGFSVVWKRQYQKAERRLAELNLKTQ